MVMPVMNFSYLFIMKRCLFVLFLRTVASLSFLKSAPFRSEGSEGSDAPKVPKLRGGHVRGGRGSARPRPAPCPARTSTWPDPAFFFACNIPLRNEKNARNASRCSREVRRIGKKRTCKWKQTNESFLICWYRYIECVLAFIKLQDVSSFF